MSPTQFKIRSMVQSFRVLVFILLVTQALSVHSRNYSPQYPCKPPHQNSYIFCNTSLPISIRVQNLINLLTLAEKITQLSDNASSIPRLGIPPYEWWSESLHGIAANGPGVSFSNGPVQSATMFPQVLLTTASFNRTLWYSIAQATAVEARAMYNVGQAGLTFWAPNVNIFRDPRWGRGQETPGEDPLVASAFAFEYVKGLQGENLSASSGGLMLSACCKHFIGYDLENWMGFERESFNAVITEQDMQDTYAPPFQSCIQDAKVSCLMCSYNEVNGIPACTMGSVFEKIRKHWEFEGYITSDCDAVATIYEYQKYVDSPEDAVAAALTAGTDINCGTYMLRNTLSAFIQGKVNGSDIDRALSNLFTVQMRLGLFDGNPAKGKFGMLGPQNVCSEEHKELALEAARQSIVLLKNEQSILPLSIDGIARIKSIGVIGPIANNSAELLGDYSGYPCEMKSIVDGLKAFVPNTIYAPGCFDVQCYSFDGFAEAVRIASTVDVVVVIAGLDLSQETEGRDRMSLLLPGNQMKLISAIADASKRPLVLVLTGGGPLDILSAKQDPLIASILWVGYPGEAGGQALAEVLFGVVNPSGRLPMTWYPESFANVPMNDMRMRSDMAHGYPGRTYRFYTGERAYNFGEGLSYTSYTSNFISIPTRICLSASSIRTYSRKGFDYVVVDEIPPQTCDLMKFDANICVNNTGNMAGSHAVLLFCEPPKIFESVPLKQLIGFTKVHVEANSATETSITVDPCKHLSVVDEEGTRVLPLAWTGLKLEQELLLLPIKKC